MVVEPTIDHGIKAPGSPGGYGSQSRDWREPPTANASGIELLLVVRCLMSGHIGMNENLQSLRY